MRLCTVYHPDDRRLYQLNLVSWLLLELCDGQPWKDVERRFLEVVSASLGDSTAELHYRTCTELLQRYRMVTSIDAWEPTLERSH